MRSGFALRFSAIAISMAVVVGCGGAGGVMDCLLDDAP